VIYIFNVFKCLFFSRHLLRPHDWLNEDSIFTLQVTVTVFCAVCDAALFCYNDQLLIHVAPACQGCQGWEIKFRTHLSILPFSLSSPSFLSLSPSSLLSSPSLPSLRSIGSLNPARGSGGVGPDGVRLPNVFWCIFSARCNIYISRTYQLMWTHFGSIFKQVDISKITITFPSPEIFSNVCCEKGEISCIWNISEHTSALKLVTLSWFFFVFIDN